MEEYLNHVVCFTGEFSMEEDPPKTFAGLELTEFLAARLAEKGIEIASVEFVDYLYEVHCEVDTYKYEINIRLEYSEKEKYWILTCYPAGGSDRALRKRMKSEGFRQFLTELDAVLCESTEIHSPRWYPRFEAPDYLAMLTPAEGPVSSGNPKDRLSPAYRASERLDTILKRLFFATFIGAFFFACLGFDALALLCAGVSAFMLFMLFASMFYMPTYAAFRKVKEEGLKNSLFSLLVYGLLASFFTGFAIWYLASALREIF